MRRTGAIEDSDSAPEIFFVYILPSSGISNRERRSPCAHREDISPDLRRESPPSIVYPAAILRQRTVARGGDKRAREEKSARNTSCAFRRGGAHRGQRVAPSARGEGEPVISSSSGYSAA